MRIFITAVVIALAGCSTGVGTKLAEQAVPKFHTMLDAGEFDAIYAATADDFKQATKREEFVSILEAVHRKLGNTKSADMKGWNINYHTSGTFITLNYATTYTEGEASEQFVYRLQDDKVLLVGYHVNSNALILK
jgi:opacity protein-like surface antigen